jgi:hypothetical protein
VTEEEVAIEEAGNLLGLGVNEEDEGFEAELRRTEEEGRGSISSSKRKEDVFFFFFSFREFSICGDRNRNRINNIRSDLHIR